MPLSSENQRKLAALTGSVSPRPLPPVPKLTLSEGDRLRMPSLAESIDEYNEAMATFFKEQRIGG